MNYSYVAWKYADASCRTPYFFTLSGKLLELYNQSETFVKTWLELPIKKYGEEICVLRDEDVEQHFELLRRAMTAERESKNLPSNGLRIGRKNLAIMKDIIPPTGMNDYSYYSGARYWMTYEDQERLTEYYPHTRDNTIFVCTNPPIIKDNTLRYGRYTPYMLSEVVKNET